MTPGPRTHEGASLMLVRETQLLGLTAAQRRQIMDIKYLYTRPERRRMGDARWLLASVCVEADRWGMNLILLAEPGADKPMNGDQLIDFYSKFRFRLKLRKNKAGQIFSIMVRKPR